MNSIESSFIQEIAQEVAMRQRQNVWVDGSLSDGAWFSGVFQDIRNRYPHYRIAIIHITARSAKNNINKITILNELYITLSVCCE
jgi:hypothetical protein